MVHALLDTITSHHAAVAGRAPGCSAPRETHTEL